MSTAALKRLGIPRQFLVQDTVQQLGPAVTLDTTPEVIPLRRCVVPETARSCARLKTEVNSECLIEFGDERRRQLANPFANPLDGHGAHLLGLGFGVTRQSSLARWKQDLERVDAGGVRGHRHHRNDTSPEPGGCGVGGIVADHDGRAGLAGFRSEGWGEADGDDLAAAHSVAQAVGGNGLPGTSIICGFPGIPGFLVRICELSGPQQPDGLVQRCGPRPHALGLGLRVEKLDIIFGQANTHFHTLDTTGSITRGSKAWIRSGQRQRAGSSSTLTAPARRAFLTILGAGGSGAAGGPARRARPRERTGGDLPELDRDAAAQPRCHGQCPRERDGRVRV